MSEKITLTCVGDVMLARCVETSIIQYGTEYIFEKVSSVLQQSDIVFGNLECLISTRGEALKYKNVTLRANPSVLSTLQHGNFTVMSVANNHIFDFG